MIRLLFLAALGVAGAFFVQHFVVERVVIVSGSMEPTLPVGTKVWVNKMVYRVRPPARGEIVSFVSPVGKKGLVKRVVAVGGDDVRLVHKDLIINGKKWEEPYVKHTRPHERLVGDDLYMGRVPPGFVVVMGDNRDESGDSRDWRGARTGTPVPFVSLDAIEGQLMVHL